MTAPARRKWGRTSPETLAEAQRLFEAGHDLQEIADRLGIGYAGLYGRAKKLGWQPKVETFRRRCPSCKRVTNLDPCTKCGAVIEKGLEA